MRDLISYSLVVGLVGCGGTTLDPDCQLVDDPRWGPAGEVEVVVETVATGLQVPWSIAWLPDGRMLVTERPGRLQLIDGDVVTRVNADIQVAPNDEGGLLGLALDPQFSTTRAFFLYVTAAGPINRVERWILSEDGTSASADGVIIDDIPAARFHNGGRLRIGRDGKLYVGTGDARMPELSQVVGSTAGKLLRLELDGRIPADNPFPDSPTFVYGLRNTQGFDWIDNDTLVITDHGPSGEYQGRTDHDEVNIARAGDNLGWPTVYACEAADGHVAPAMTWSTALPPGGAAIYSGDAISEWRGSVLIGTLGSQHLHRVVLDGDRVGAHEVYLGELGRLRDVVMGPDAELYVTTSNCDGRGNCPDDGDRILRITR